LFGALAEQRDGCGHAPNAPVRELRNLRDSFPPGAIEIAGVLLDRPPLVFPPAHGMPHPDAEPIYPEGATYLHYNLDQGNVSIWTGPGEGVDCAEYI